ncbi:ATP-grasp domain-containing protein [Natronobacterium gregoryi]|uniref:Glutathione synthase/ribosomal protein S6 modification enzyme (Glutaminyl transferase) n=2 Tax=Natronobacterium gregoryi TaxID=44930 RepID=L0AIG7_NATGS|nr:RimK family alpha-L-glutamate ligase [Natronobacterium gregoryi]AFZ72865.1 glutathione synthase/ribosomal protein S6 modification enzyme (glutaminyl transferase) [Natronobacterium gregoryi SP2]ELY69645.1 RimK domain-containing protein ATP-grasp [Natronobacterium gregoryi SP2]PLK21906.1 RimK family alpha-L-glutamate ligase [Natronobacterium gregoryi SP2]SFI66003.1 ribosomal protein S6--L-glutamate ligase [Natronobacterium gregoryi]
MIDLAVANDQETFERMRDPLEERGIRVHHVPASERVVDLTEPPWGPDEYDVGFVYPGRLMEGGVADALLEIPWLNDHETVSTSRNKAEVLARLERDGLPVPKSVYVSNDVSEGELAEVFERFEPPVVVKPNSTTRGVGVAKAHDLDSFLGICDYLSLVHDYRATGDRSFLVQEYVPNATDYRVMVLERECVGAVERRLPDEAIAEGQWKHNVHRGAEATGVDLPAEHRRLAESVAEALEIPFVGVDLLETADRLVVNETNARPTIDEATKYESGFYDRLASGIRTRADTERNE